MAIKRIFYKTVNDINLYMTYSDSNMMILQNETGIKYVNAVDPENSNYTYSEIDEPIPHIEDEISDTEALNIIIGNTKNNDTNAN